MCRNGAYQPSARKILKRKSIALGALARHKIK
uniref:Uncharacterized protein n=1 Tax=Siphoviridae sp. ctnPP24 TaxID=2825662 RepID=A0A8S5TYU6_9CAUD|nr:MAG TPA: hypothetical protein [Siphoviridae sp. ctnPP24]